LKDGRRIVGMKITALGAAREVGRSAFLLEAEGRKLILDFGVLLRGAEPAFPIHVQPKDIDAVILSHAHLDHSGATPLFFLSKGVEMYCTGPTLDIANLLIKDFIKISAEIRHHYLPFEYLELETMVNTAHQIPLEEEFKVGPIRLKLIHAGHMPGSSSILVEADGKRVIYTGDINSSDSNLMRGAVTEYGELDFLLMETTYGLNEHPPREQVERDFVAYAREVVERGGTLLVPAFAVGRAQEIACVLYAANFPHPVAMDGIALKTNEILFRHQEFLKDPSLFRRTIEHTNLVKDWKERRKVLETPGVIIAPAGMLVGGSAAFYNSELSQGVRNGIAIVAFQIPGTPGRTLLDKGLTMINGKPKQVKSTVRRFDFSSHSGSSELLEMVRKIKGHPTIAAVHGEEIQCSGFTKQIEEKLGLKTLVPQPGEIMQV
jgi:putative mRNA 3-end processing factor